MAGKRHTAEQVVRKLREAEIELARGQSIKAVCKKLQITDQTYYRWRREYGGLQVDQARRLKDLERENGRLKKLLAEAELDKAILKSSPGSRGFPARRADLPKEAHQRAHQALPAPPAQTPPARPKSAPLVDLRAVGGRSSKDRAADS